MTDNKKQKYIYFVRRWNMGAIAKYISVIADSEAECYKLILREIDLLQRDGISDCYGYKLNQNERKVIALSYLSEEEYPIAKEEIEKIYQKELSKREYHANYADIINDTLRFELSEEESKCESYIIECYEKSN
jgi:uncharacterized protein YqgQ